MGSADAEPRTTADAILLRIFLRGLFARTGEREKFNGAVHPETYSLEHLQVPAPLGRDRH
ncbi:hypothetical protein CBM2586_B20098 [Cupriavidus phytorum]|uniref:Uncharacterized protein n=1 Tax=Cupriavidus taiwanensis TaxID=164546 RepID=A0A375CKL8_9BURK|nr:hypothetical protein CBM2586_B20098 [Cupriavidus taiwanensis]